MEGIFATVYRRPRRYWKTRSYERLARPPLPDQTLPPKTRRCRPRVWRIRVNPRLQTRLGSPKKWLNKLRDGYMKMMLKFANSAVLGSGFGSGGAVKGGGSGWFAAAQVKEYDEKVIAEIYKSLVMAQVQLVHREKGEVSSRINSICAR